MFNQNIIIGAKMFYQGEMTRERVLEIMDKQFELWKDVDDSNIAGYFELICINSLMQYCHENRFHFDGYDMEKFYDFYDSIDADYEIDGEEEEEFGAFNVYIKLSWLEEFKKLVAPKEFWDVYNYFHDKFWPNILEEESDSTEE